MFKENNGKAEEKQNTLDNIMNTGQYTINHVTPAFYQQAHQCAARYGEGKSEFEAVGLTPEYAGTIHAPFVKESTGRTPSAVKSYSAFP